MQSKSKQSKFNPIYPALKKFSFPFSPLDGASFKSKNIAEIAQKDPSKKIDLLVIGDDFEISKCPR